MTYSDSGTMIFRAFTAGGALPVAQTVIRIRGADENNSLIEYSLITDSDGLTPKISLPSPKVNFSLEPSAIETPYALYDIEASADGYYTKRINNVPLFSNINSFQPINMIPIAIYQSGVEYPLDTLNSTLSENPFL